MRTLHDQPVSVITRTDDPFIESLAASLGHDRDTLENVVEPYIIQQGYVQRSRTGRVATAKAYAKFGLQKGS